MPPSFLRSGRASAGGSWLGVADGLKTILIFCGAGLLLSLAAAMTSGLNLAADLF
jgi:hypothetical protein